MKNYEDLNEEVNFNNRVIEVEAKPTRKKIVMKRLRNVLLLIVLLAQILGIFVPIVMENIAR